MTEAVSVTFAPAGRVRSVPVDRPWQWLAAGWSDMTRAPHVSLACGLVVFAASVGVTAALWWADAAWLVLPMLAGFMLVGPMVAIGLYEASRRLGEGERPSVAVLVTAWRRNPEQVAVIGLVLMLLLLAWVRVATLLYALFFSQMSPSLDRLAETLLFSPASIPFLLTGSVIGLVFAVVVFSVAAVSIPILMDKPVGVVAAVWTSVATVRTNFRAMALWASLIVVFTAVGVATFFLGLIVALPLIGHATWHAYKDMVELD